MNGHERNRKVNTTYKRNGELQTEEPSGEIQKGTTGTYADGQQLQQRIKENMERRTFKDVCEINFY